MIATESCGERIMGQLSRSSNVGRVVKESWVDAESDVVDERKESGMIGKSRKTSRNLFLLDGSQPLSESGRAIWSMGPCAKCITRG